MEEQGGNNVPSSEKHQEESTSNKTAQCSVISVYRVKIGGVPRLVTVVWNKNIINQSFTISIDRPAGGSGGEGAFAYKVELKPWPFWSKKGLKTLDIDGDRLDIFWDLRSAKFTTSPEPVGGYYVALVSQEEVILLLGDGKKDAYKRTKSRPSLEDAVLVCKRENVFGKKSFAVRAQFDTRKKEHEIIVESSLAGPKEPEMWLTVDGYVLVHVKNLQWKFRGNETVVIEKAPVQVFWDVHDWIFSGPGSQATFIFKPGAPPEVREPEDINGDEHSNEALNAGDNDASEFSFFLHAWKME